MRFVVVVGVSGSGKSGGAVAATSCRHRRQYAMGRPHRQTRRTGWQPILGAGLCTPIRAGHHRPDRAGNGPNHDGNDFLALLDHIVAEPSLRVLITLRADFYARAIEEPILARLLRRDRGTFPLDPPGIGAIHQMIIRPAEAAGVELEDGLAQGLLDDAGEGPGADRRLQFR